MLAITRTATIAPTEFCSSTRGARQAVAAGIFRGGGAPKASRTRLLGGKRGQAVTMPCIAPPRCRHVETPLRIEAAIRLAPVNTEPACHRRARSSRAFSTAVRGARFRPVPHLISPMAGGRGMAPANPLCGVTVIPIDAIGAATDSFLHLVLPQLGANARRYGSALTTASSAADQSPPSAKIRATVVCNLRASTAIAARCASSAAVCAVTTSR